MDRRDINSKVLCLHCVMSCLQVEVRRLPFFLRGGRNGRLLVSYHCAHRRVLLYIYSFFTLYHKRLKYSKLGHPQKSLRTATLRSREGCNLEQRWQSGDIIERGEIKRRVGDKEKNRYTVEDIVLSSL